MQTEKHIAEALIKQHKTIAIAESCTGGLVSHTFTNIPGSSAFFRFGVVAYSNEAKKRLLKVSAKTLASHGAVSAATAQAMAQNIRKILKTNIGIGITGIAGPSGGSKTKPVGLVYIAVSSSKTTVCREYRFKGSRLANKNSALRKTLRLLLTFLTPDL